MLLFDALRMTFRTIRVERRCEQHAAITHLIDYEEFCNRMTETDITPSDLAARLAAGESIVLVDVRENHEWNTGHHPSAVHIPLGQLGKRVDEIPRDAEVVMICRTGSRSAYAQAMLKQAGFAKVKNLVGGMMRWARDVDPTVRVA
jgi:adenylyltransferase/sulfurtransferase